MFNWLTGKLAVCAVGGLLIVLLGVSAFATFQHSTIRRLQAEAQTAEITLNVAKSANVSSTAMIASLVTERDTLLLKRAAETEAAIAAVAESQAVAEQAMQYAMAAKERIRQLSLTANCRAAMEAKVCPQIAEGLRAP